jgi:Rad3-related DNA helicase
MSSGPMHRWSKEKLFEVKAYLEGKDPTTFAREDHHLTIDYIAQRYLPDDYERSGEEYQASRAKRIAKIDENYDRAMRGEPPQEVEIKEDPEFAEWLKATLSNKS